MQQTETRSQTTRSPVSKPSVSVIIPAYNVARFIDETLNAVFAQTFTEYEVIVVNDGSPDTPELERALEPYLERIRYLKQENRGAAAARNLGLRTASGAFAAFLDADDVWLPEYLAEQIKFIKSRDYDLVYSDALIFGDQSGVNRTYMETAPSDGEVTFHSLISGQCNVITSGVVVRRQLVLDVGAFDERLRNSHDFDLWVRLVRHGTRMAYQRKVLLRYRFHEDSLSGDALNRINRELLVLGKIKTSYNLTPDEELEVSRAEKRLRSALELESGRLHLESGEFADARAAFKKANNFHRSWKLHAAILLLPIAPRLLRSLYLSRRRRIQSK